MIDRAPYTAIWSELSAEKSMVFLAGPRQCGKTTLAQRLSSLLHLPHYDLDDLFWKRKYDVKRLEAERQKLLKKISAGKHWIIEGVYSSWIDDAVRRSDVVLILDFHFFVLARRLLRRPFLRGLKREGLADTLELLRYAWRYSHRGQPNGFHSHRELAKKHHARVVYIRSDRDILAFLQQLRL